MKEQKHIKSDGWEFEELKLPFIRNNPKRRKYIKNTHNKGIRRFYKKFIKKEVL